MTNTENISPFNFIRLSLAEIDDDTAKAIDDAKGNFKSILSDIEFIFMERRLTRHQFIEKIFDPRAVEDQPRLNNGDLAHDRSLDRDLARIRNALALRSSGMQLFIYLAVFHNPKCLKLDGDIDIGITKETIEELSKKIKENYNLLQHKNIRIERLLNVIDLHRERYLDDAIEHIHFEEIEEEVYHFSFGKNEFFDDEIFKIAGKILQTILPGILPALRKIRRIVVLAPKAGEMIYKLGAEAKLVGAARRGDEKNCL